MFKPLLGNGSIHASNERIGASYTASWCDASIIFDHRHWACRDAELSWTAPYHMLVLTQKGRTSSTRIACSGQAVYDGWDLPGAVTFIPAGAERQGAYRDVDMVYSALWISPHHSVAGAERHTSQSVLVNRQDAVISALFSSLAEEIIAGSSPDTAYVEYLSAIVMLRIALLDGSHAAQTHHTPLSRAVIARVRDYVEANLSSELSLTQLAELVGIRLDTFSRRFKATTGITPHAYIVNARIRRAESLLANTELSISSIAFEAGFSSQSHLTTTFHRATGLTPRAYRLLFFPDS